MSRHDIPTLRFDCPADAAHHARTVPRTGVGDISDTGLSYDWDAGHDLPTALAHSSGDERWNGVAEMMQAMEITDELTAKSELPQITRSLVGGNVNVPAYLSGHPLHMRRRKKAPRVDKPVMTIGVSLMFAHFVSSHQRLNLGAAILSAVDELETRGYRCEIIAFYRGAPYGNIRSNRFTNWVNIETTLKRPDERWNPSAIAYAVAHPAFMRRTILRVVETMPEAERLIRANYGTCGTSSVWHASCAGDFDLYIPNMADECQECQTPHGAFQYVQRLMSEQLERAKRGGEERGAA